MELNETDLQELHQFIYVNRKIVREFSEEYLILFNFATDCIYAQYIQPELIKVLLPFYLKAMEEAVLHENEIAMDIYNQFNTAMFFNQKNFKCAVGEKSYFQIMQQYIKLTIQKMERYCRICPNGFLYLIPRLPFAMTIFSSYFFKYFTDP
ncbi:MAG: hypothetical protein HFI71_03100 [Lachnospiraceae bacterium]|nr:hypothetical protein [Lachnospiraceae bacterium]